IFRNIEHISCSVYKNLHSIEGKRRMQLMIYHIRITVFRITDIQIQIHFLLCIFDYTEIDSCLTGFLIPETDSQCFPICFLSDFLAYKISHFLEVSTDSHSPDCKKKLHNRVFSEFRSDAMRADSFCLNYRISIPDAYCNTVICKLMLSFQNKSAMKRHNISGSSAPELKDTDFSLFR